jgi:hypothetical protein
MKSNLTPSFSFRSSRDGQSLRNAIANDANDGVAVEDLHAVVINLLSASAALRPQRLMDARGSDSIRSTERFHQTFTISSWHYNTEPTEEYPATQPSSSSPSHRRPMILGVIDDALDLLKDFESDFSDIVCK